MAFENILNLEFLFVSCIANIPIRFRMFQIAQMLEELFDKIT